MVTAGILSTLAFVFLAILAIVQIILIVKVFKHAGAGLGILAIFCAPFAFIWGWIKSKEFGLKGLMIWYTLLLLISVALFTGASISAATDPEMQKAIREIQEQQRLQQQGQSAPGQTY